ncbi:MULTISPECIES: putative polysaccharide biosynthesis protein [Staphylococcus]|uniref:putative polysaccharide biosynthesis protein n=1 Tax=Staphylococcus TaxID=1279 RepID=UPI0008A94BDE|nr:MULTISPECIES: polysaccharide biosynthesis protein [Staphylococcus]MCI2955157.1 polysaccharide biosynthesis protein [Staphylococcus caprae]OHO71155.1 polysaccharide biosynthesis protein [Staphylococcus sp. HMSC036D05]POA07200.1 polysaccharide biosynthesis protein [Staphylococcus caprae]SUL95268.1 spore cortex protein; Membrane protein involved in the export of O-antigen, teichoic acid lipoteichoic acids [Staphylococcus caprae]HCG74535.1 polysaccharide biosynthesis protein [Staphylococcus sp.
MSESKEMVRGTFLITLSILITKVLGVLFIIPFTSLIGGQENMAPFTYAYAPYNIAIAVATAGVPLAASKYVAKYNAIGAYKVSQKFYKSSFIVMSITGIIGFLILYFLAPYIAELTLSRNSHEKNGWSVADITWIIRIISMVVIFIPVLATWRGIFQGYKSMGPTAVSEVTEQIARIIFILVGSYLALNVFNGTILQANGIATFAAAIGAIAGIITLWYYWIKRRRNIKQMVESDTANLDVSYGAMYKEIIAYSIPFVIVSLNFPLFNLVDQFTHNGALSLVGVNPVLQDTFFNMLNMSTNKIVMIPTSLSAGFAVSLIPYITKTYEEGRLDEMHRQIRTSIGVLMFITVPASIGIMALAQPLFTVFYGYDPIVHGHDPNFDGSRLLFYYSPVAILISLLSVTASMLQGIDKQKLTVYVILGSVLIKLALNYPLIMMLHTPGAVLSTAIALLFANACNFYILKKYAKFKFSYSWIHFGKIFLYSFIMMIGVEIVFFILKLFLEPTRFGYLIIIAVSVVVGALIYGGITIKNRLADEFLGDIPGKIRRKVKFLQ